MNLQIDPNAFESLVERVVASCLDRIANATQPTPPILTEQLVYSETQAAKLLGLNVHQLRDERRRGRISHGRTIGKRVAYSMSDIQNYLSARRCDAVKATTEREHS